MIFIVRLLPVFLFYACSYSDKAAVSVSQLNHPQSGSQISLAFVGDVLLHQRLRHREEKTKEGYRVIWTDIAAYLERADISYANLEGPVAPQLGGVSGYPMFNFPVRIIPDLKDSGFDVVSTANNHALDRGAAGVDITIDNLREHKMIYTGTIKEKTEPWWAVVPVGGQQVAFLACTESLNGHRDVKKQVLLCFSDKNLILDTVRELSARTDIAAVILLPHWGEENILHATAKQRNWARDMIDTGAVAVVGAHPHVVQPIELYTARDGRAGWISYSLGNFISNQSAVANKLSMVFYLKLRFLQNGKAVATEAKALPLWMSRQIEKDRTATYRLSAVWDFKLLPPDAGKIWNDVIPAERNFQDRNEIENFLKN